MVLQQMWETFISAIRKGTYQGSGWYLTTSWGPTVCVHTSECFNFSYLT